MKSMEEKEEKEEKEKQEAERKEERRKLKRIKIDLPVHVHMMNERNIIITNTESHGMLYDFSAGGCAFSHKDKLPVGDRLQLRIELNDELSRKYSMKELTVRGTVLRCVRIENWHVVGIRFSIDR